jgi:uncharacterized protein YjiS (DUF1127 family)
VISSVVLANWLKGAAVLEKQCRHIGCRLLLVGEPFTMGSMIFQENVMSKKFATRLARPRKFRPLSASTTATRASRSGVVTWRRHLASAAGKSAFNSLRQFLAINRWPALVENWWVWKERMRQRAELRDIADDPRLLADLGITRNEALAEANKPFWR